MTVSSLIFVVIVAIWAAYLVQHWVRRREDAAATRSVDGFTEAMRVLEKRPILPRTELRTPRPDSYAVQPARDARPTVDVKRAVPAGAARRLSPLVARRANDQVAPAGAEVGATHLGLAAPADSPEVAEHADITPNPLEVHPMPVAESTGDPTREAHRHGRRAGRPDERVAAPRRRVSKAQRRLRGLLLLVALAWVPVSVALAITGVLMWISVPFSVVTVVAVLVWLRTEAQSDRLRAMTTDRVRRRRPRPDNEQLEPPVLSSEVTQVIHSTVTEVGRSRVAVVAHDVVFDVQAAATGGVPVAQAPAVELPPGSWSPVPVPKPTYTLKAKAEPRYTESGIPADVFDTPEFADEADELDERARFARRAASQ